MSKWKCDMILQFFEFKHLPPHLQTVSAKFADMAHNVIMNLPDNPERELALRKLLEAKDCAVRAMIYRTPLPDPDELGPEYKKLSAMEDDYP